MDLISVQAVTLLILITLISLYLFSGSKAPNLPPGPFNLPFIGSLHRLGSLPHISLHSLSKKYGGVMYLKLGSIPTVILSSEKAAREIFKSHALDLASKAPFICGTYFGNNRAGLIFNDYNEQVKHFRKLINTHVLSATRLKVYDGIRREEQLRLARSIWNSRGKPIVLREKLHAMNMNVISYMLFGQRFCDYDSNSTPGSVNGFIEAVVETVRIAGVFNFSDFLRGIRWLDVQGLEKKYKSLMETVNAHLFDILRERRENPPVYKEGEPVSFIDVLISMDSTPEELTKITLLFDVLLGAVDTSALSLEWAMAELLRHPEELHKAQREVDNVAGNRKTLLEESDIVNLPYIEAIAKETLRLRTITPIIIPKVLQSKTAVEVCGYTIPKGTVIYINGYSIGIDESFWKNPLEFQPQRFIDEDVDVFGKSFNFLPFGTGRRVCPGSKLGFDAVQTGMAILIQGFDWKFNGDLKDLSMDETYGLVSQKTDPLVVIPTPRLDSCFY